MRGSAFNISQWDDYTNHVYTNDWSGSSIQQFLNGDYFNRIRDAIDYGLKTSAKNMVDDAVFYLGLSTVSSSNPQRGSTENIYTQERGNILCSGCGSDTSKIAWVGKVCLMYPSDQYMIYGKGVEDECFMDSSACFERNQTPSDEAISNYPEAGWIYNSNILVIQYDDVDCSWFISPVKNDYITNSVSYSERGMLTILETGGEGSFIGTRPVVYLKSNVKIVDGDGSEGNPYVLQN